MTFLLVIPLFFLSGWISLRAVFGKTSPLSILESAIFSFLIGVGVLDFSIILADHLSMSLSAPVVLLSFLVAPLLGLAIRYAIDRKTGSVSPKSEVSPPSPFSPTKLEFLAFLIVLTTTVFLRTLFLSDAGLPTSTDLGHHTYWSKLITETGTLPEYAKREILLGETPTLSDPQPIADFIIGEHIPFAAVAILSGQSFFSAFPVGFLFLVNLLSLLALFALSIRISENIPLPGNPSPFSVGLAVLFLAGPLFAFSSPESKFVSGGVVGNIFGNLLIPAILLLLLRALQEKDGRLLALGAFLSFTLAYTHHLSSLVLILVLFGILLSLATLFGKELFTLAKRIVSIVSSPAVIGTLVFCGLFFFLVAMPTYIETHAANTAIGAPTKATRTGLTFQQASDSVGTARIAIGIAALLIAFFIRPIRQSSAFAFVLGWGGMLLVMTLRPHWVFLDIPSNRVGAYLSFPLTLLSGLFIAFIPSFFRNVSGNILLPGRVMLFAVLAVFAFSSWNGSSDNQSSLVGKEKELPVVEVYAASSYLASRPKDADLLLKDHNYLVADSWMKLFFMKDYNYPLSRGFFKRYEDETKPREQCTLLMISAPNLPEGKNCYDALGVNLIAVHPLYDAAQFEKSASFSRIYAGNSIHIYERK